MATKANPLAGIPVITATTPTGPKPTNINSKRKRTAQEYKDARDGARSATGYNDTSPIWGKPTLDVLIEIDRLLGNATPGPNLSDARELNEELRKRFLSYKLTSDAAK